VPGQKIFYFIKHTANLEGNSGIQRVTRHLGCALREIGREVIFVSWLDELRAATRSGDDELRRLARWNGPAFHSQDAKGQPLELCAEDRDDLAGSWLIVPECPYYGQRGADPTLDLIEYAHRVGLRIAFVFYDLVPIKMRGYESLRDRHVRYVQQLTLADMIIPISQYSGDELACHYADVLQLRRQEISQIVPCLLPDEFAGWPRVEIPDEPEGSTIRIICLGTLEPRRNHPGLLEAFNVFCAEHPEVDVRLKLIGNHAPGALRSIAGLLERNPRIEFAGFLPDENVFELYRSSHFTVFPSIEEGYGLPIAESLWFGKPCLCANFGAMAEAARGGGCLTVDTRSAGAIKKGLECLILDGALRQELAWQCTSRAIRTWHDYGSGVLDALDRHTGIRRAYYWVDFTVEFPINTGIQRVTRVLARSLEELGIDLQYVRSDQRRARFAPLNEAQRRHLAEWNGPPYRPPQPLSQHFAGTWLIVPEILAPPEPPASDVIRYARSLGMRVAFLFYDLIPLKLAKLFTREHIQGFVTCWMMMREADVILPISMTAGEELEQFYAHAGRSTVRPNLIEPCSLPGEFLEQPRTREIRIRTGGAVSMLCVGTIDPRKNQLLLIDALEQLWQAGQADNISLVIAGSSRSFPEMAADLMRKIADLPNVKFLDQVDDVTLQELYTWCDFTVYASYEEGFGLPILESLWNARPCLCHNTGAIAEVASNGGCYMVNMRDVGALREGIQRLSEDQALYNRLAAEAVSRPMKTWAQYASEVARILSRHMWHL